MSEQRQQENSKEFLQIYTLRKNMLEEMPFVPEEWGIPGEPKDSLVDIFEPSPYDLFIHPGEIRLLSETEDLQYVVVMEQRGWNFLVVPFSRYSMPATDGELLLKNPGNAYLSVLQVWNARTICATQLCKSWVVREMNSDEMKEIWTVRDYFLFNTPLPGELIARTGAEILSADDPRNVYLQESVEVFAEIDRQDFFLLETMENLAEKQPPQFHIPFPESVMAAAGEDFLSDFYIVENQRPSEIITQLVHQKIPGALWSRRAVKDIDSLNPVWKLTSAPKGVVNVLFWQRSTSKLFGLGVLSRSGKIYLQYFCNDKIIPPASDLILLGGK